MQIRKSEYSFPHCCSSQVIRHRANFKSSISHLFSRFFSIIIFKKFEKRFDLGSNGEENHEVLTENIHSKDEKWRIPHRSDHYQNERFQVFECPFFGEKINIKL